ncbi:SIS domain-containing protein [Mycetocola lacteus]|uniref:SIS domain-containing protein n=2 Tax=Mycetocola lacteus TaxID=76637 RepID=A0A3L7AUK6_9MICO|nr:SIS domain-containing protein [Mycetocola lacteus]
MHRMESTSQTSLFERLKESLDSLRKSERKVAELVTEDPTFVMESSMSAVAARAGVSEPTVMRFCTGLGFDGFQAFKLALAQALILGVPSVESAMNRGDSVAELASKIFDQTISSIDRSRRFLDLDQMEQAVTAILGSRALVFIGLSASGLIAQDALQKAQLFGIPCSAPSDTHQQFMAAAMTDPETTFVVISNTGRTRSTMRVAEMARSRGATVIGISGDDDTPMMRVCDVKIVAKTFENTDIYTPTVSRLAGLVVIDILSTAVSLRRGEAHFADFEAMKAGLAGYARMSDRETDSGSASFD